MIRSMIFDFGLPWVTNRFIYSLKLKMLRSLPVTELLFEKKVIVKRLNLFNINTAEIERFLCSKSEVEKKDIIDTANKSICGKIRGFSSVDLDYGDNFNWHFHPISQTSVNNKQKWFNIPDFDAKIGDIKVVWEASRLTHFFYFTRAYMLTKDKKYYHAFSQQLNNWIMENPYSYGANYKCGQEATLRMISALIAYSVFLNYGLITKQDHINLKELVKGSYKKVLSNFFYANKCIKNNHTLSEICGLIIGSWCCQDNDNVIKSYKMLDKEIKKQFSSDGGYIQNSFNYQRFALQIVECVLKLSEVTNIDLSENSKELISKSAILMYQMQEENGDLPNRGANDGALIFPVTSCDYRDFRPVINSVNCILNNERLFQSGQYDEEILWFSNKKINSIPIKPIKRLSSAYYEAGMFSIRTNENSFLMTILKNNKTRPSHMDQLHIDLWHKGINIFCDNGSYSYADPNGKNLTLTSSHNTVKVNGIEQMNKKGSFLVTDWTKSENVNFRNSSFKGTMVSKNGYKHTRYIEKTNNGYLISDDVIGVGEFIETNFNTPCEVRITSTGFELYHNGACICNVVTNGTVGVKKAYRSLYYLKKDEINCVTIKSAMVGNKLTHKFNIRLY